MEYKWNYFIFACLNAIITFYKVPSSIATCVRPDVKDPDIDLIEDLPIYEDSSVVILFCDTSENYVGYGPVAIYCSVDTWIPDPSQRECKAPCDAPIVSTGVLHYDAQTGETRDVYLHDTALQFACEDTETTTLYHDRGLDKTICADGIWDYNQAPICAKKCGAPLNAIPSGLFQHMSKVTFTCESGFQAIGPTTLDCSDGQWNDEMICEAIPSDMPTEAQITRSPQPQQTTKQPATAGPPIVCDFPDTTKLDPDAVVTPMQDGYPLFSIIELSCAGTQLITSDGPQRFACYNRGVWLPSPEDFKCYRPCNAPQASANVDYITLEGENEDELYSHNAVIGFGCSAEEQLLYGASLASCYDGKWNPEQVPTCEDVKAFELKFQITHIDDYLATYLTDYADRESQTFREMEAEVVHAIASIYTMLDGYLLSKIVLFSDPGTSGLDVYAVVFIDKSSVSGTLQRVTDETKTTLNEMPTIDGLSFRFTLDEASVLVTEPCEAPDLHEDIAFESSDEPLELVWYPDSTIFSLSCVEEGYVIDGALELTCENGAWLPEGETLCIEIQTTPTADITETLRQTTSSTDEITMTAQAKPSTIDRTDTPTDPEMSSPGSSSSTITLAPQDTTGSLQTISSITEMPLSSTVSEMTAESVATQLTTFPSGETSKFKTAQTMTATWKSTSAIDITSMDSTTAGENEDVTTKSIEKTDGPFTVSTQMKVTSPEQEFTESALTSDIRTTTSAIDFTRADSTTAGENDRVTTESTEQTDGETISSNTGMPLSSTVSEMTAETVATQITTFPSKETSKFETTPTITATWKSTSTDTASTKSTDRTDFMTRAITDSTASAVTLTGAEDVTTSELLGTDATAPTVHRITVTDKATSSEPATDFTRTGNPTAFATTGMPLSSTGVATSAHLEPTEGTGISGTSRTDFSTTMILSVSPALTQTNGISSSLDVTEPTEVTNMTPEQSESTATTLNEMSTPLLTTTDETLFQTSSWTIAGSASVPTANTEKDVTTNMAKPSTDESHTITSLPQIPSRTITGTTNEPTDAVSQSESTSDITLVSMTASSQPSGVTSLSTSILTPKTFTTSVLGITTTSVTEHPISATKTSLSTPIITTDSINANSATTDITKFHATIEETEASTTAKTATPTMTETKNRVTSQTSSAWVLTTISTDETTEKQSIQTSQLPTDVTSVANNTDYTTDEHFQTDSDATPTQSDNQTTSEATDERTEGVLETSSHFTSYSRATTDGLTSSQDKTDKIQTSEDPSTSLYSDTSRTLHTESVDFTTVTDSMFTTDEEQGTGTLSERVTDGPLTTFRSATTSESLGQTTHTSDHQTKTPIATSSSSSSSSSSSATSSMQTNVKTDFNKGYSTAVLSTGTSRNLDTTVSTTTATTTVELETTDMANERTGTLKTMGWDLTQNSVTTKNAVFSTNKIMTTDGRTTTFLTSSQKSEQSTEEIKQTTDETTSTTGIATAAHDITSQMISTRTPSKEMTTEQFTTEDVLTSADRTTAEFVNSVSPETSVTSDKSSMTEAITDGVTFLTTARGGMSATTLTSFHTDRSISRSTITNQELTDGSSITPTEWMLTSPAKQSTENALASDMRTATSATYITSVDSTTAGENDDVTTKVIEKTDGPSTISTQMKVTPPEQEFTESALTSDIRTTASAIDFTSTDSTTAGENDGLTTESTEQTDGASTIPTKLFMTSPEQEFTESALTSDMRTTTLAIDLTSTDLTTVEENDDVTTESTEQTDGASTIPTELFMTSPEKQSTRYPLTMDKGDATSAVQSTVLDMTTLGKNTAEATKRTYGSSSTPTERIMTSGNQFTENALTSDVKVMTSKKVITTLYYTTVGETTGAASSTHPTASGIMDSTLNNHETIATSTDINPIATTRLEATERNIATQTQEPCGSCNPVTETCLEGRCKCRPSKYKVALNDGCSDTRSFTLTFRVLLINDGQATFSRDLMDKQSPVYNDLQGDLVTAINSVFDGLPSFLGSEIISFQSGSIIAISLVYFASYSSITNDSLANHVDDVMIKDDYRIRSNSTYILDASNIIIEPSDECLLGLDDCSPFASCSDTDEEGFNCTCNEGYTSVSNPPGLLCQIVSTTSMITEEASTNSPSIAPWIFITLAAVGGAIIFLLLVSLICVIRKSSRRKITHPEDTMVVPKSSKDNKLEAYRGYYTSFNESIDDSSESVEDTAF